MDHIYLCVVHEPKPVRRQPKCFDKPPAKVTNENKSFWKHYEEGGSICKECYSKFKSKGRELLRGSEVPPEETKKVTVCFGNFVGMRGFANPRYN